jgi:hypothetical protein
MGEGTCMLESFAFLSAVVREFYLQPHTPPAHPPTLANEDAEMSLRARAHTQTHVPLRRIYKRFALPHSPVLVTLTQSD